MYYHSIYYQVVGIGLGWLGLGWFGLVGMGLTYLYILGVFLISLHSILFFVQNGIIQGVFFSNFILYTYLDSAGISVLIEFLRDCVCVL